ncbi:MAG: TIM barrel protein [Clostridia bacterium]|nr:TIM barrel protein [Clostridia bacterium]
MLNKIGLQTFTIRKNIKSPDGLEKTLEFYLRMGINNFELSRIKFDEGVLNALSKLKETHGINYTACQITLKKIISNFDFLMEFCSKLDIHFIEVSVIPAGSFLAGRKGIVELAAKLNELGKKMEHRGVRLLYHHHNFELIKFGEDISFDLLMKSTDADYVNFVCDTYWLAKSGYNPAKFIEGRIDRIKGVHLRDNIFEFKRGKFISRDGALGDGTIDFAAILKNDWHRKIDFYSIEQDTKKPEEDILRSYNYIRKILN